MVEYKVGKALGLDEEQAAVFEWQFRFSGDFARALMQTIALADEGNKDLLAKAFPIEVAGFRKFSQVDGWWEGVLEKANEKEERYF